MIHNHLLPFLISGSNLGSSLSSVLPSGNDLNDVFGSNPRGSKDFSYSYLYFQKATNRPRKLYFTQSGSQVVGIELLKQEFSGSNGDGSISLHHSLDSISIDFW